MSEAAEVRFACDAMLGGLARWLRAAGYDASWHPHIGDWELIRLARNQARLLLSSDTGIFRIGVIRDRDVPSLWIPHALNTQQQLGFVLRKLQLPVQAPRCMACGGSLLQIPKERVTKQVPPRSYAWAKEFSQCQRCGQVFWQGTHWEKIADGLQRAQDAPLQAHESTPEPAS
jgi:uncharacterized protein with PIN domain